MARVNPVHQDEEQDVPQTERFVEAQAADGSVYAAAPKTGRERAERYWRLITLRGPDYPSRRIAARKGFLLLLGMSVLFGAMAGLAVVYSIDLPQMEDLARYRPNTTTELLDIKGREIGSFALERRIVVPYSDIPPVLKDAILSIEDKHFESNWGINLARAVEAAYTDLHQHSRAQGSSTLTMQLARNLFPFVAEDV